MGFFIDKHHRRKSSMAVTAFFAALIDLFVFGILYGVLSEPLYRLVRLGSEASSTVVQGILIALLGTALCCLQFLLRDKRIAPYGFAGLAVALLMFYVGASFLDADVRSDIAAADHSVRPAAGPGGQRRVLGHLPGPQAAQSPAGGPPQDPPGGDPGGGGGLRR